MCWGVGWNRFLRWIDKRRILNGEVWAADRGFNSLRSRQRPWLHGDDLRPWRPWRPWRPKRMPKKCVEKDTRSTFTVSTRYFISILQKNNAIWKSPLMYATAWMHRRMPKASSGLWGFVLKCGHPYEPFVDVPNHTSSKPPPNARHAFRPSRASDPQK